MPFYAFTFLRTSLLQNRRYTLVLPMKYTKLRQYFFRVVGYLRRSSFSIGRGCRDSRLMVRQSYSLAAVADGFDVSIKDSLRFQVSASVVKKNRALRLVPTSKRNSVDSGQTRLSERTFAVRWRPRWGTYAVQVRRLRRNN